MNLALINSDSRVPNSTERPIRGVRREKRAGRIMEDSVSVSFTRAGSNACGHKDPHPSSTEDKQESRLN